jgi:hypothetical protein
VESKVRVREKGLERRALKTTGRRVDVKRRSERYLNPSLESASGLRNKYTMLTGGSAVTAEERRMRERRKRESDNEDDDERRACVY